MVQVTLECRVGTPGKRNNGENGHPASRIRGRASKRFPIAELVIGHDGMLSQGELGAARRYLLPISIRLAATNR